MIKTAKHAKLDSHSSLCSAKSDTVTQACAALLEIVIEVEFFCNSINKHSNID